MKGLRPFVPALLLSLLAFGLVAMIYAKLPLRVPVHWNISGEVDGSMIKPWGALVLPMTALVTTLLLTILPLAGKGFGRGGVPKAYPIVVTAVAGFMLFVTAVQLLVAMNARLSMPTLLTSATGILLVIVGNYLGKVPRNRFIGIRVPWTLASDYVWERTHRLAAPLTVMAGIAVLIVGLTQPAPRSVALMLAILTAALLPPVIYSYLLSRRNDRPGG
ncbi:MAG: SdpI family protein [Steroidobacteraceae bacterium]